MQRIAIKIEAATAQRASLEPHVERRQTLNCAV
jgi:hypothetical protein